MYNNIPFNNIATAGDDDDDDDVDSAAVFYSTRMIMRIIQKAETKPMAPEMTFTFLTLNNCSEHLIPNIDIIICIQYAACVWHVWDNVLGETIVSIILSRPERRQRFQYRCAPLTLV